MIQEHEIVLYQVEDTNICVNVVFKDETYGYITSVFRLMLMGNNMILLSRL